MKNAFLVMVIGIYDSHAKAAEEIFKLPPFADDLTIIIELPLNPSLQINSTGDIVQVKRADGLTRASAAARRPVILF